MAGEATAQSFTALAESVDASVRNCLTLLAAPGSRTLEVTAAAKAIAAAAATLDKRITDQQLALETDPVTAQQLTLSALKAEKKKTDAALAAQNEMLVTIKAELAEIQQQQQQHQQ